MFYVVGLGNPGEKYTSTRHNVGWQALDVFLHNFSLPALVDSSAYAGRVSSGVVSEQDVTVLYPDTFMNNSGSAVAKLVPKKEISQLIVVHDDVDLPFGEIKIAHSRGAGGNNGVASIIEKMGGKEFIRVRIGVSPKSLWTGKLKRPAGGGPLEKFVLKSFTASEKKQLPDIFKSVQTALEIIFTEGVQVAMNRCN